MGYRNLPVLLMETQPFHISVMFYAYYRHKYPYAAAYSYFLFFAYTPNFDASVGPPLIAKVFLL